MEVYHKAVLLGESVDALISEKDGIYVDCTFGGGGHSREILSRLSDKGKLYAFDQDVDVLDNVPNDARFILVQQNFRYMRNYLKFYKEENVDGILADLGVSSHQFDEGERGFSIRMEGPLDMRMNKAQTISAKEVINTYEEEKLADIFYYYGELKQSRKLAKTIVTAREEKEVETTQELKDLFKVPGFKENKFYAQLFQALRIEVNDELNALKEMLMQSYEVLKPGGKLVVISYHSLEDRLVKKFMRDGMFSGEPERDVYGNWDQLFELPKNKLIVPTAEEIEINSRARSAKLRVAIKK